MATINQMTCKIWAYVWISLVLNPASHLVILAVDRALSTHYPIWHYNVDWTTKNRKISCFVTAFNLVYSIPLLIFYQIESDGVCRMPSKQTLGSTISLLAIVFLSIIVYNLMTVISTMILAIKLCKPTLLPSSRHQSSTTAAQTTTTGVTESSFCGE